MPEEFLDHADGRASFEEMRGAAVPQRMRRDAAIEPGRLRVRTREVLDRLHLTATSLKADPGAGLATTRDVSRAARGGGRMIKSPRPARPVTDQSRNVSTRVRHRGLEFREQLEESGPGLAS